MKMRTSGTLGGSFMSIRRNKPPWVCTRTCKRRNLSNFMKKESLTFFLRSVNFCRSLIKIPFFRNIDMCRTTLAAGGVRGCLGWRFAYVIAFTSECRTVDLCLLASLRCKFSPRPSSRILNSAYPRKLRKPTSLEGLSC